MQSVVDYLKAEPTMFGQFEDFKDTWACGLTLVLSVTGGTDWVEPFSKMQLIDRAAAGTFLAYILVYILVIVNVVTSVFLSRVMKFAEPSPQAIVEEKELMVARDYEVLEKMFRKVDQDSTGGVSLEEFQNCVGSKEFGTFLAARGIDIKEARAFFNLVTDRTYEGEVDVGEMVRLCTRLKGSASSIDLQIMRAEINATCRRIEEAIACGASSPLSLAN
jgi:hypothetical protein